MKKTILALVLLLSVFLTNAQGEKTAIEKVIGEKTIPSITLADMNGKQVDVASYTKTGKITVLSFWATWCVPCKKELTNIADVYDEWKKKYNMQIIAVSIDDSRSATKVKPTVEGQRWEYEVLLDVNQDLKRQLNIQSVPFTLLVDAGGKIVYSHSGYVDGDEYILEEEIQKLVKKQ
ncbi:MAG TPA: TlpA disulfide reductase family protein [Chitinophagales bacterium]|nr:TlpA disulfide reductase family protein [Chitinophagales bacterium]